jgi:hypothetical protein
MRCPTPRNGHPCKSRRCPQCGLVWAGDVRRKLFANFGHYEGQVALISVTAPGQDVLPWDGKFIARDVARRWNRTAPARWRELHRTASQNVRRRLPRGSLEILGRVWEYQKRGALHVHVVVGVERPINRHAAQLYTQQLKRLTEAHGFGYVDGKWSSYRGQNAAAYLSSYFIGGEGRKATVRETVTRPDVPPHVVYVASSLTTATGCTMRSLRRVRYLWVIARQVERGELVPDENGELVPADRVRTPLRL